MSPLRGLRFSGERGCGGQPLARLEVRDMFLRLRYSRTPVPPYPRTSERFLPSGGRLGGGFSLFDNAKVLIFDGSTKQVVNPVRSEKWEKRKVTPSHRNGATFALE